MGRLVLTESCVIQCAHGGTVQHPSSDSIRTIGGLKPNFTNDILNAPISGCPVPYTPCTKVAAISSAMTETNVTGSGGNYALDVSACQTDQGAPLQIASRANSNSSSNAKSGANNKVEGDKASKEQEQEAKSKEPQERYNLYLLRESHDAFGTKVYKPLRPSRAYADIKTFYGTMDTHPHIREKIVPYTLAFVYIKLAKKDKIEEYRIISKGSLYSETFKDIQYKDEENNVSRDYIPLYDGEEVTIAYSNVQLSKDQGKRKKAFDQLVNIKFDPTDSGKVEGSFFLKDPNSIDSNRINVKSVKEQKKFDPVKEYEAKVKQGEDTDFKLYPLNTVMTIPDAFGEVEDLLNVYEWRYKQVYSANDTFLKGLRNKNAYVYSISSQINYFYVDSDDRKKYKNNILKLKRLYRELADEVCKGSFASLIVKGENNIAPLDEIIKPAYTTAVSYLNEVLFINRSFFDNVLEGVTSTRAHHEHHPYSAKSFTVSANNLACNYVGLVDFTSVKEQNVYKRRRYSEKIGEYSDIDEKKKESFGTVEYGYLVIDDEKEMPNYAPFTKNAPQMLGLLVFALFFSKHYQEQAKKSKAYDKAKEFFYLLKQSQHLPPLSDDDLDDVKKVVDVQKSSYSRICSGKNKLIEQFEKIDDTNKSFSFDLTKIEAPKKVFSDLYLPKEFKEFHNDGNINPKEMLQKASDLITKNKDLKKQFEAYKEMTEFDSLDQESEYLNSVMGMLFTLMENKSTLDAEAFINSPFNDGVDFIRDLIKHVALLRLQMQDAEHSVKVFMSKIREHYTNVLFAHLGNSYILNKDTKTANEKGFEARQGNAKKLLEDKAFDAYLSDEDENVGLDISNFNNLFFEKKQEKEDELKAFVKRLKAVDGYNANFAAITEGKTNKLSKKSALSDDMLGGRSTLENEDTRNSFRKLKENKELYKALRSYRQASKSFSTVVLLAGVATGYADWKQLKGADMYSLMLDTTKLATKMGNKILTSWAKLQEETTKLAVKEGIKELGSLKLIARAGLLGVLISTASDVEKLDKDDVDGKVVTIAKGVLTIGLLLAPIGGWAVAGISIAMEIAWVFVSKTFVDTPIEAFIYKSLLFNVQEDSPTEYKMQRYLNYFSSKKQHPYEVKLLSHTFQENLQATLPGFDSLEEVQNFIGDNYDENAALFESALEYELTALKAVAYGYKIEVQDTREKGAVSRIMFQTKIKIPKEMLQNNISVYFKVDGKEYTNIYKSEAVAAGETPPMPQDFDFDTAEPQKMNADRVKLLAQKSTYLLVINEEIVLKYKLKYHLGGNWNANRHARTNSLTVGELELEELELQPLTSQEEQMVHNDTYAYEEQRRSLAKAKEKKLHEEERKGA